ncbi:MAG: DUF342 domain-containing protein, partial [Candidatus Omnitrophica bacterium]|nr:DUF342 domain-containing protein [Candidatus Omnitrophota bacterium]
MNNSINDIEWKVSDDRISILARFPEPTEDHFDVEEFNQVLARNGVTIPCDQSAFLRAQKEGRAEWTPVGWGTPPTPPTDARLEYYVNPTMAKRGSQLGAEEKVDFKELRRILNVEKGQELVRKHDPIPGTPGWDVYGNPIPADDPKNISIPIGQGVELREEGHLAIAVEDGAISRAGQQISVIRVYPVSGNISYRTGNIHFKGTVDISGDVQTGFEVHADGDILIKGLVEGAHLVAG